MCAPYDHATNTKWQHAAGRSSTRGDRCASWLLTLARHKSQRLLLLSLFFVLFLFCFYTVVACTEGFHPGRLYESSSSSSSL